ncbi:MAG: PhzF family phenazine biosynthesis protein [Clostridiales bacterium]|jgi:PhzF family phenazine biosynthesis protein|nr:PhzF family phenazine biosynthesis protein [Clostridiales bacterium]
MKIIVASAFSKDDAGGNKAGVCLVGERLTREQKMAISKELGCAETAFVSSPTIDGADWKFEYFTPSEEVALCGHATIAGFTVLREYNLLKKENNRLQTKEAVLDIVVSSDKVTMQQNNPQFGEMLNSSEFGKCFDIEVAHNTLPIQIVSTGLRDIMLPIRDLETLQKMTPNFDEITAISEKYDTVGIHAFVLNSGRILCRNFAPRYDVPEESATGTSNCALACYLWQNGIMRKNNYTFEQGYSLDSPSEINVALQTSGDNITKVTVGGSGYVVEERNIELGGRVKATKTL